MRESFKLSLVVVSLCLLAGCMSASEHSAEVQKGREGDRLTVGTVQREIHQGMSGAEVTQALGAPNIVTTDEQGREVWVYDRVSTDSVYSSSQGGVSTLILGAITGGSGFLAGAAGGDSRYGAGAKSTSQRTLTIIIKFDEGRKVRDFAYHSSNF